LASGERKAGDSGSRVSPADIVFIVVVFLLLCTSFAISEGLVLGAWGSGGALRSAGESSVLHVTGFAGGSVEIEGRRVDLASVGSAIRSALAYGRVTVVAEYGPGADPALVADVLDTLKAAGVRKMSMRKGRK
jgi:biopolymer transport protein ExbD